jgi:hypothetical protein
LQSKKIRISTALKRHPDVPLIQNRVKIQPGKGITNHHCSHGSKVVGCVMKLGRRVDVVIEVRKSGLACSGEELA